MYTAQPLFDHYTLWFQDTHGSILRQACFKQLLRQNLTRVNSKTGMFQTTFKTKFEDRHGSIDHYTHRFQGTHGSSSHAPTQHGDTKNAARWCTASWRAESVAFPVTAQGHKREAFNQGRLFCCRERWLFCFYTVVKAFLYFLINVLYFYTVVRDDSCYIAMRDCLIVVSHQEPVSGPACNPPKPHWFFLSFSQWRSFTVLNTKVAPFS